MSWPMRIGVIKEIKDQECRVALTPDGARQLVAAGHQVMVENEAGTGSGFENSEYEQAGAVIADTGEAWHSDLVLKIKEPQATEYRYFDGQILFTYLHLAGVSPALTKALIKGKVTAIAYECVTDADGRYPLLAPMSAIAGNMACSIGGYYLARTTGGKGIQLGRVMDRCNGKVMVIGDGIVGMHAVRTACGLGANVFLFGRNRSRHEKMLAAGPANLHFVESSDRNISEHIRDTDLVVGAVLLPGDRAPHVVSGAMVETMQTGSVIVDVSIDQGGCIETSRPTSHTDPVYRYNDVIHYCVTNMPGAYPRTATHALTDATLPYIRKLADKKLDALSADPLFAEGVNTYQGFITSETIARSLQLGALYKPLAGLLGEPANLI